MATGFIGFLHTPAGRPLLAALGVGCPVKRVTPAQAEALRQRGLSGLRGARPAPARPALGLSLDVSTEKDVKAWASRAHLECAVVNRGLRQLSCSAGGVPNGVANGVARSAVARAWVGAVASPGANGEVDLEGNQAGDGGGESDLAAVRDIGGEVTFAFNPSGNLVSVDLLRSRVPASTAARLFTQRAAALRSVLGNPAVSAGDATSTYLESGPMRTARLVYRFSDYVATVTAMNLPPGGVALRELYQSARGPQSPRGLL